MRVLNTTSFPTKIFYFKKEVPNELTKCINLSTDNSNKKNRKKTDRKISQTNTANTIVLFF